jgi:hypothetical protein
VNPETIHTNLRRKRAKLDRADSEPVASVTRLRAPK